MKVMPVQNSVKQQVYSPKLGNKPVNNAVKFPTDIALGALIGGLLIYKTSKINVRECSHYLKSLAMGVSEMLGEKINPKSLACVMDKSEFVSEILKLKKQNYVYTPENIKNFGFMADFHMHTNHSDGNISVGNLLDEITEYGNKLFARTGKKFMFSITDHDSVAGVKEALGIIAKNPEKFRNVRFIPGVELSFSHKAPKSANPCEISEVLAYGFDPFKLSKHLDILQTKRVETIDNMLAEIRKAIPLTNFNKQEMLRTYNMNEKSLMMNTHWAVNNYAQAKHALTIQASRHGQDGNKFYEQIIMPLDVKNRTLWHLKEKHVLDNDIGEASQINDIRRKYQPHMVNNKLILNNENSFEDIIDYFKGESVTMAFAHPYFTAEKFHFPVKVMNSFIHKSKGLIELSEAYHQAYPGHVNMSKVEEINDYLKQLIKIGGSDNHKSQYI